MARLEGYRVVRPRDFVDITSHTPIITTSCDDQVHSSLHGARGSPCVLSRALSPRGGPHSTEPPRRRIKRRLTQGWLRHAWETRSSGRGSLSISTHSPR